jgi:hypothetical protein
MVNAKWLSHTVSTAAAPDIGNRQGLQVVVLADRYALPIQANTSLPWSTSKLISLT